MSMKAEAIFGAVALLALAFLAYCLFILPPKSLRLASGGGSAITQAFVPTI